MVACDSLAPACRHGHATSRGNGASQLLRSTIQLCYVMKGGVTYEEIFLTFAGGRDMQADKLKVLEISSSAQCFIGQSGAIA